MTFSTYIESISLLRDLLGTARQAIQLFLPFYRGADKSLVRPGRKQVTATEDFEFHIFYLLS